MNSSLIEVGLCFAGVVEASAGHGSSRFSL